MPARGMCGSQCREHNTKHEREAPPVHPGRFYDLSRLRRPALGEWHLHPCLVLRVGLAMTKLRPKLPSLACVLALQGSRVGFEGDRVTTRQSSG